MVFNNVQRLEEALTGLSRINLSNEVKLFLTRDIRLKSDVNKMLDDCTCPRLKIRSYS